MTVGLALAKAGSRSRLVRGASLEHASVSTAHLVRAGDPVWYEVEARLLAAGVPLPLAGRSAWAERARTGGLVVARAAGSRREALCALEVRRPRALPGHRVWRLRHVVPNQDLDSLRLALAHARALALGDPRVVRLDVAGYALDTVQHAWLEATLRELGYSRHEAPEGYRSTSLLDLRVPEPARRARMTSMGRRNLRLASRRGLSVEPLVDDTVVPALEALVSETRTRTGGAVPERRLAPLVALARARPDLVRVAGLRRTSDGRLLAFAVGEHHGDHATYGDGGSTRAPELRVPLGYLLLDDLASWAARHGAATFDLGGLTRSGPSNADDDPLGGISHFKRQFGGEEREVGSEWTFVPRPRRAGWLERVRAARELVASRRARR